MQAVPFINMQQLIQLQHDLQNDPNNDDLKGLIWQAKWNLCSLRNGIPLEASDFSPRLQGLLECRFPHYIPREPLTPLGMLQNSLNLEPSTAEILYSLQEVDNQLPNFSSAVLHQFYKDNHHLELEKNRPSLRAAVEHTLLLATSHLSSDDQDRIYGEIYRNTDPLPDEPHYGENHLLDNWDRFALVATDVPFLIENDPNEFLSECMQPLRALLEEKAAGGDSEELQERIRNAENAASVSRNIYKSLTYIGLIPNNALGALQNTLIDTCHEIEMSEQVRGEIIQDLFLQIEETIPGFTRALRDQFPDHAPLENLLHFRIAIEQTLFRAFREQLSPDQQEACFGRIWGNTDPRPNEPFYGEVHLLDCWDRFGESIDPHTLRFQTTFDQVRKLIEDRYQNPEDAALLEALINAQEDHIIERNQTEALGPYVDNPGTTELGKLQNMLSRNHVFFRHSDIINSLERQEDVFPGFTAEVLIRLEKDTGGVNLQNFQNLRIAIELTLLEGFYQQLEPEEREGFYLEMAGRSLDEHTEDYYFETHLLDCWEEFGMGIQPRRLHFHSGDLDLDPLRALIREQKAQPDQMDLQERVQNAQSILCRARNGAPIHPEEMQRCGLNLVIPPHINRAINPFPQTLLGQLQNQLRTGARIWEIRDLLKQIDRECIPGFSQALQHELNKSPEQPINRDIRVAAEMTLLRLFGEQLNPAEQEEVYGNIWRNSTSRPNLDSFGQTNLLECWDRFAISIPEGKLRLAPTKIDYSPLRALIQQRNNHPDRAGLQDYVKATEELFCKLRNGMPLREEEERILGLEDTPLPEIIYTPNAEVMPLGRLQNLLQENADVERIGEAFEEMEQDIPGFGRRVKEIDRQLIEENGENIELLSHEERCMYMRVSIELFLLNSFREQLTADEQNQVFGDIYGNTANPPEVDFFGETNLLECWDRFALSIPEGCFRGMRELANRPKRQELTPDRLIEIQAAQLRLILPFHMHPHHLLESLAFAVDPNYVPEGCDLARIECQRIVELFDGLNTTVRHLPDGTPRLDFVDRDGPVVFDGNDEVSYNIARANLEASVNVIVTRGDLLGVQNKERFYTKIEKMLKVIFHEIDSGNHDAAICQQIILHLGTMHGHCGGRYISAIYRYYSALIYGGNIFDTVEERVHEGLHQMREGILDIMMARDPQNEAGYGPHVKNKHLQNLADARGIRGQDEVTFQDVYERNIDPNDSAAEFDQIYTVPAIRAWFQERVNGNRIEEMPPRYLQLSDDDITKVGKAQALDYLSQHPPFEWQPSIRNADGLIAILTHAQMETLFGNEFPQDLPERVEKMREHLFRLACMEHVGDVDIVKEIACDHMLNCMGILDIRINWFELAIDTDILENVAIIDEDELEGAGVEFL